MHGLILAGGEGSRLAAGGIAVPKPLVEVAGKPQIVGLLETLAALGCSSLTCAVRADFPAVRRLLDGRRFGLPLTMVECRTPSSLHTLVEGLAAVPPGPVFCSMVDTVMRPEDWRSVYRGAGARRAAAEALGRGVQRMRGFLKALVDEGRRVAAVEVARIIDIDRPSDLQTANAWLAARER